MNNKSLRGASIVEFTFVMLILVPLLLGTTGVGINMVNSLQTIQLARDIGHMYARGVDFSQPGNQQILIRIGASVGMSTVTGAGSGNAVVILSKLTYIDNAACIAYGPPVTVNGGGQAVGCTNLNQWVFAEWMQVGNTTMRASNLDSPLTGTGPGHVTFVDSNGTPTGSTTGGRISRSDQVMNTEDQATFSASGFLNMISGGVSGLPTGQFLYVSEAAAQGFTLPPYMSNPQSYSYGIF